MLTEFYLYEGKQRYNRGRCYLTPSFGNGNKARLALFNNDLFDLVQTKQRIRNAVLQRAPFGTELSFIATRGFWLRGLKIYGNAHCLDAEVRREQEIRNWKEKEKWREKEQQPTRASLLLLRSALVAAKGWRTAVRLRSARTACVSGREKCLFPTN